ncbi:MAG: transposase [Bdellovibrionaceae bacterium]|nr:transposase [Pseudobdellovibrionaceae bacterium]
MSRKSVIYTCDHPYHVSARFNNREWLEIPMSYAFGIYGNILSESIDRYHIHLHAFVLMNNHFHMIVSTPESNIGNFLKYFMTKTSKGIANRSQRINHIYGGRNHKSLIDNSVYYAHCLKYVLRNPVKAGVCTKVEDYPWSSISKKGNKICRLITPLSLGHEEHLPTSTKERISWFNVPPPAEVDRVISQACKRSIFKPKTDHLTKKHPNLFAHLPTPRSTKK